MLDELYDQGHTIILVTHEDNIAEHAHRTIKLRDGKIETDVMKPSIVSPVASRSAAFELSRAAAV
jgi:putative ABC transport system ATP-binding protein